MESLSRAKEQVPSIKLTKVEFSGPEGDEITSTHNDSGSTRNGAKLGHLASGIAQSTKNLSRDNDGGAYLLPRSPVSEPDTSTKKIEIAVALYDFEAQRVSLS